MPAGTIIESAHHFAQRRPTFPGLCLLHCAVLAGIKRAAGASLRRRTQLCGYRDPPEFGRVFSTNLLTAKSKFLNISGPSSVRDQMTSKLFVSEEMYRSE